MSRIYEQPSMTPDDTAVFAIEKGADNNWTTYKTTWGSLKTLLSAATDIQYNAETGVFTFTKTDGNVITITPHDPTKVDKVAGKGLSENDFTNTLKTKLDNIAAGAEANVQSDWNQTNNEADDYIKNKPTIPTVDAALDATSENAIQNKAVKEALDDKVDAVEGKGLSTEDYTAAEKTKLAGVEAGANNYVLPPATASTLGGVKPGINMSVDANGVLSMASTDIVSATEAWLDDHIDPTTGYAVDNTLEVTGAAADAKTAGDKISEIKSAFSEEFPEVLVAISKNISPTSDGVTYIGNYRISYDGALVADTTYYAYKYPIANNSTLHFDSFGNNTYAMIGVYNGEPSTSTFEHRYNGASPTDIGIVTLTEGQVVIFTGTAQSIPSNLTFVHDYFERHVLSVITQNQIQKIYVSSNGNDETGNGTKSLPFATIAKALSVGQNIMLEPGTYSEELDVSNMYNISICADTDRQNTDKVIFDYNNDKSIGFTFDGVVGLYLSNIEIKNTIGNGCNMHKCANVHVQQCGFNYCGGEGLSMDGSTGIVVDCEASHNGNDGFNIHEYGDTSFLNCEGHYNGGDGISHHNACTGLVYGGKWTHNTKAGIATPTYGAKVNIANAFLDSNYIGLQIYGGDYVTENAVDILVNNCVIKGNTYGVQVNKYAVSLVNCVFVSNSQNKLIESGTLNEY